MTTTNTTAQIDLATWCRDRAAARREYEQHELPMYEDRDVALIEWTVRVLGNPLTATSAEVLRIIAAQHGLELAEAAKVAELTAELERLRQQRDRLVVDLTDAGNEVDQLTADLGRARAELATTRDKLTAANRRADGLQNDLNSATKANTAYAQQVAELQRALDGERKAHAKTRDYIEAVAR